MCKSLPLPEELYINPTESIISRIEKHITRTEGCWYWSGYKIKNYGQITYKKKNKPVHRIMWAIANKSDVPPGLVLRHTCDNPSCVNPDHLVPSTQKENLHDCIAKKRKAYPQPRLFCVKGHPRTPETVRRDRDGGTTCRLCDNERNKIRRSKKLEK